MKVRKPVVLNDVCPWESVELSNDAKLMTVTVEQQPSSQLPTSSSTSSMVIQATKVAVAIATNQTNIQNVNTNNELTSSDEENNSESSAYSRFRRNCCMGDCRHTRFPACTGGKKSKPTPKSLPKNESLNWRKQQPLSLNSSPLAKFKGVKRFLSLSSLAKKQSPRNQVQFLNPEINISSANDDEQKEEMLKILDSAGEPYEYKSGIESSAVEPTVYIDGEATAISETVSMMIYSPEEEAEDKAKNNVENEAKNDNKKISEDKAKGLVAQGCTSDTINVDVKLTTDKAGQDCGNDIMSLEVKPDVDVDGELNITETKGKLMIEYLI